MLLVSRWSPRGRCTLLFLNPPPPRDDMSGCQKHLALPSPREQAETNARENIPPNNQNQRKETSLKLPHNTLENNANEPRCLQPTSRRDVWERNATDLTAWVRAIITAAATWRTRASFACVACWGGSVRAREGTLMTWVRALSSARVGGLGDVDGARLSLLQQGEEAHEDHEV